MSYRIEKIGVASLRAVAMLAVFAMIILCAPPAAGAVTLTLKANVAGNTPEIVGYNSGHFMPNTATTTSNTADWWRYSGVNGARVWPTPTVVEASDDISPWGDGVSSESTFISRRSALRANPLSPSYINWNYFDGRYQNNPTSGANIIKLKYAFGELHKLGIDPLVVINRTNGSYAWDPAGTVEGWKDRWEHWQHYYAQAFYLARHFDVHRFQMYNEPNGDDIPPDEWLERLRFASDAVQAAVADVNALYGKSLDPQMQGPVTAGNPITYYNTWGKPVMDNLHTTLFETTDPNFNLIDTYAYQRYNLSGEQFGSELANVKNTVKADAGGTPLRFAITEFNVHTAANFDTMSETLDTPSKSSRFGSILANLANKQPHELYVFKFSQGPGTGASGVKKNGTHYVDNNSSPYNIGGVTKGGEVVRLFAKGFAGANELFDVPTATGTGASDLRLAASHNQSQDRYYLFSANESTSLRPLTFDLTPWGIQPGVRIIVEEVSADRHGEVSHVLTVPQNRIITLPQGGQTAQSVLLFSIPKFKSAHYVMLNATDDAMVKSGTNANSNFGTSPNLLAKNEPVDPAARNVSFIKFNTGSIITSAIDQAILNVYGENTGSASQVIAHVYGIFDDNWNESTINWSNAPNLKDSLETSVDDISENFIEGIGASAQFVGHFTGIAASRQMSIDVTSFVRDHPNQEITFLIAREVRFDGENVDDALTSLQLASKERGTNPGPQLMLSLSGATLEGDYDQNGVVDAADYETWKRSFAGASAAADGSHNGIVDAADYVIWRHSMGNMLPGTVAGSGALSPVPEPSAAVLCCLAFLALAAFRSAR